MARSLFFFFMMPFICLNAQSADKWRSGSAVELKGKIYILSIFVTSGKKEWSYNEKIAITARQLEAQEWLTKQAQEYNTELSFENGFYGVKTDIVVNKIVAFEDSDSARFDWVYYILTKIGYSSPLEFLERLKVTKDCDNAVVIIYPNQAGRSFAVPYNTDYDKEKFFFEGCVAYRSYKSQPLNATTIAHEILHLFGAWDLYQEDRKDAKRSGKAWELYPKDIMYIMPKYIDDVKLGILTAWLVGLYPYKREEFELLRPKYRQNE